MKIRAANRGGFTIIEVIVAIILLSIGVLTWVGTSAAVTRMLARGNRAVRASMFTQERVETLASTPCQLLANGSATRANGFYSIAWTVTTAPGGNSKRVQVINTYLSTVRTTRADTTEISVLCIR